MGDLCSCCSCFVARNDVSRSDLPHLWNLAPTFLACDRASRMENAAGGRGQGRRDFTLKGARRACPLDQRVRNWSGVEQSLGIGMERPGVEFVAVGDFGDATE